MLRILLVVVLLLPTSVRAADDPAAPSSACQQLTPADAAHACVEVIPPGASVWITLDDVPMTLSPLAISDVPPGPHTLRLDRRGDAPRTYIFDLQPGEVRRFDDPLEALPRPVAPPGQGAPYPLAVMVENYVDARPQAGLDRADVVYEALAEGGISRFLALYLTRAADTIGPVRSTRHYFVYAAAEYNATLVHIGASPIGYAAVSATALRTLNESAGDAGVWRSTRRPRPHNAYTSTGDAHAAADAKGASGTGTWGPLLFKAELTPSSGLPVETIEIRYPPLGWYDVGYRYDPLSNRYGRVMDGLAHRDQLTGEQLEAANLIVQIVPDEVIDREGRLDLAQLGEGPAYFFLDGVVVSGSWTKADYGSRTLFWDTAGNLMRFNPDGTTWIQLVPPDGRLTFR